jgi:hypothetical protein
MASRKENHLEKVQSVRDQLLRLLDGMDYCLDWKPDPSSWSARQVVYHVLDTPPGGLNTLLWSVLSGELEEIDLWADRDNITPDRLSYDLEQVSEDINEFFRDLDEALESASPDDIDEKSVLIHFKSRDADEKRTLHELLEGAFDRHWQDHLGQISELREALGM